MHQVPNLIPAVFLVFTLTTTTVAPALGVVRSDVIWTVSVASLGCLEFITFIIFLPPPAFPPANESHFVSQIRFPSDARFPLAFLKKNTQKKPLLKQTKALFTEAETRKQLVFMLRLFSQRARPEIILLEAPWKGKERGDCFESTDPVKLNSVGNH